MMFSKPKISKSSKNVIKKLRDDIKKRFSETVKEGKLIEDNKVIDNCEGQTCSICFNFSPMSTPNQDDGSFICWSCRNWP